MTRLLTEKPRRSLDEVLDELGNIPMSRIRLPLGTATEADVIDILDRGESPPCELVDGVLVEKTVGLRESVLAAFIGHMLREFADKHDLGVVFGADGPTRLRVGLVRIPDTGFVSWERFPNEEVPDDPISTVIPDLAVEVISKSNTREEMERKLRNYFDAGVRLVWYIYPKTRTALAYTSPKRKKEIGLDGALDGGKVLPGFSLPLEDVFSALVRRKKGDGSK
jgi:Uma2 family endonuclease